MEQQRPERRYWFRAKRYGWGWTPATWQGWALIAAWAVAFTLLIIGVTAAASASNVAGFVALLVLAVASILVLALLSWRYGEPPRWRWGK